MLVLPLLNLAWHQLPRSLFLLPSPNQKKNTCPANNTFRFYPRDSRVCSITVHTLATASSAVTMCFALSLSACCREIIFTSFETSSVLTLSFGARMISCSFITLTISFVSRSFYTINKNDNRSYLEKCRQLSTIGSLTFTVVSKIWQDKPTKTVTILWMIGCLRSAHWQFCFSVTLSLFSSWSKLFETISEVPSNCSAWCNISDAFPRRIVLSFLLRSANLFSNYCISGSRPVRFVKGTSWIKTQILLRATSCSESFGTTVVNELSATDNRASFGHFVNQSMVQQFTKDGNIRQRCLRKHAIVS